MSCRDYEDLLSAYLDRELRPSEQSSVAEHVNGCEMCKEEVKGLLALKETLRAQPMPSLPANVIAEIEARTIFKPHWYQRWGIQWIPAIGLTAAVAASLFVLKTHKTTLKPLTLPIETLIAQHHQFQKGEPLAKQEAVAWQPKKSDEREVSQ